MGEIMRLLLIHIAPGYEYFSEIKKNKTRSAYYPPLGLLYIGSAVEQQGHSVEIIDFHAEKQPFDSLKRSLLSTDVVGVSVYTQSCEDSVRITDYIKEMDSNLPVLIGGPHCSLHPKQSLVEIPSANISVQGDAEKAVNEILQVIQGKGHLSKVAGIHYRNNGQIKAGKPQSVICDLDSLPFPARPLVKKYNYGKINNAYFFKPPFTSMISSRGCPFRCRFCTRNTLSYKTYRRRSVENFIQEFKLINESYKSVIVVDDNFMADKKWVSTVMDQLIKMESELDIYVQGARIDTINRELLIKMKKAGVKHLYFGIESGNQDVLNYYRKKTTLDQIRKNIEVSHELGFYTLGSFIIGAPIETKKNIKQTIKFACSLPLDGAVFNIMTYKYGSDLYDEAVKEGKIKKTDGYTIMADSNKGLGNFTLEELGDFYRSAIIQFNLRPRYLVRHLIRILRTHDIAMLKNGFNYFSNIFSI
jgi:radical SAM superfamily enzyme YgiQ (UPF0313 family)